MVSVKERYATNVRAVYEVRAFGKVYTVERKINGGTLSIFAQAGSGRRELNPNKGTGKAVLSFWWAEQCRGHDE